MKDCSGRMNSRFSLTPILLRIPMQLACIAARTDRGVQLHSEAWPNTVHYWRDRRCVPKVLHFSAFIAYSLCFHVITLECRSFTEIAIFNVITDGQTQRHTSSSVTLAAHVRRGLITHTHCFSTTGCIHVLVAS